ncbi:O-antigen ligase family protein [Waterburya agarophytonicola K14]|uniref:O-antigen ligase family protein n=1 Tax=Waterburya agarophytonicola KI4 TaxID=2874699 RepID=A0A964FFS8_9CYAN|nr:O-antigen ligase [Waterburya agarophytonicola]MCC0177342.1 O-antigen ligase family protein [Waterburya agarophytonicola KI4]
MTKSQSNFFRFFEYIFSIFSLVHISQAIVPLILTNGSSEGDGVDIRALDLSINAKISILIYILTFCLLAIRWKRVLGTISSNKSLWILLGIVCFSYFWSINPPQTMRFAIYAIGTTGFGLYLATRYTLSEQLNLLAWTYGLLLILSILFAVGIPKYGLMEGVHDGAFRGVFTHKNQFGAFMAPGGVIFLLNAFRGGKYSWVSWGLLVLSCATMVWSRSTTALGTFFVMLLLCMIYRIFRWRYEVMISAILAVTIISFAGLILLFGLGSDSLLDLVGKDVTLSGRTDIWQYVWDQIQLRPWFGYGLAAFWNGYDGPSGYVQLAMRIAVIYAHNGFLDIWLSLGFLGLFVFVIGFLNTIVQSLALLRKTNTPEGFWPLLFLTYILLSNLTEGTISNMNSSFWALYTAVSYSLVIAKNNQYAISE